MTPRSLRLAASPERRTHSGVDGGHVVKVARVCRAQDGCDADRVLVARLRDLRGTPPSLVCQASLLCAGNGTSVTGDGDGSACEPHPLAERRPL